MLSGKYPGVAKLAIPMVDVRDAALAHLRAAVEPEAKNQRFLLVNKSLWMAEIAQILKSSFPTYKIPTKVLPLCTYKMMSVFSPKVKLLFAFWGKEFSFKNEKS